MSRVQNRYFSGPSQPTSAVGAPQQQDEVQAGVHVSEDESWYQARIHGHGWDPAFWLQWAFDKLHWGEAMHTAQVRCCHALRGTVRIVLSCAAHQVSSSTTTGHQSCLEVVAMMYLMRGIQHTLHVCPLHVGMYGAISHGVDHAWLTPSVCMCWKTGTLLAHVASLAGASASVARAPPRGSAYDED